MIMIWPGIGLAARYFDRLADELAARGYHATISDLRGQGDSVPKPDGRSRYGMHALVAEDYSAVDELVAQAFPDSPRILLGHSLGGQLGSLYAARPETDLAGLILVASGTPFSDTPAPDLTVLRESWAVMLDRSEREGFLADNSVVGAQSLTMVRDIVELLGSGRYDPSRADLNYEYAMARTTTPVLAVEIPGDARVPPCQTELLLSKFRTASITRTVLDTPLGHNSWAKAPTSVVDRIDEWLHSSEIVERPGMEPSARQPIP